MTATHTPDASQLSFVIKIYRRENHSSPTCTGELKNAYTLQTFFLLNPYKTLSCICSVYSLCSINSSTFTYAITTKLYFEGFLPVTKYASVNDSAIKTFIFLIQHRWTSSLSFSHSIHMPHSKCACSPSIWKHSYSMFFR